jgi:hypothetical protein
MENPVLSVSSKILLEGERLLRPNDSRGHAILPEFGDSLCRLDFQLQSAT